MLTLSENDLVHAEKNFSWNAIIIWLDILENLVKSNKFLLIVIHFLVESTKILLIQHSEKDLVESTKFWLVQPQNLLIIRTTKCLVDQTNYSVDPIKLLCYFNQIGIFDKFNQKIYFNQLKFVWLNQIFIDIQQNSFIDFKKCVFFSVWRDL